MLQELLRLQALVEERPKDATTILQTELPKALSTALPTLQASICLPVPCHLADAVPASGSSRRVGTLDGGAQALLYTLSLLHHPSGPS